MVVPGERRTLSLVGRTQFPNEPFYFRLILCGIKLLWNPRTTSDGRHSVHCAFPCCRWAEETQVKINGIDFH